MMSWQPRMIDMNALSFGPARLERVLLAREDVEATAAGRGRRPPPRTGRTSGRRSRRRAGLPGIITPRSPSALIRSRSRMPSSTERIAVWPDAEQPVRMRGAVLGDPLVVGVEARVLEVEVGMVAEHHADGRVEDLGRHAVALLIGEPRLGIPAAAVHVLEAGAEHRQLLGALAGGGDEAHRDRLVDALDDEEVAALRVADDVGRAVLKRRVDPVDVRVRRLGDVRVGGDDRFRHRRLLCCHSGTLPTC